METNHGDSEQDNPAEQHNQGILASSLKEQNSPHDRDNAGADAKKAAKGKQQSLWVRWKKVSLPTKLTVFCTAVVAIATVLYACFAGRQWQAMRDQKLVMQGQLDQMKGGSIQTDRIITEARRIADSMGESIKQSKAALELSERQAQSALNASAAAIRLDQRPWLTVARFALSSELEEKKEIYITYWLQNTGKTPALDEVSQGALWLSSGEPPMTNFQPPARKTIIPPGTSTTYARTDPWLPPAGNIALYTKKTQRLYLHVKLSYRDTFGVPHWTSVCAYHICGTPLDEFSYCVGGNQMDQREDANEPPDGGDRRPTQF